MTGTTFIYLIVIVLVILYSAWLLSRIIGIVNDKNNSHEDHDESRVDEMKQIVDDINEEINYIPIFTV